MLKKFFNFFTGGVKIHRPENGYFKNSWSVEMKWYVYLLVTVLSWPVAWVVYHLLRFLF